MLMSALNLLFIYLLQYVLDTFPQGQTLKCVRSVCLWCQFASNQRSHVSPLNPKTALIQHAKKCQSQYCPISKRESKPNPISTLPRTHAKLAAQINGSFATSTNQLISAKQNESRHKFTLFQRQPSSLLLAHPR